MWRPVSSNALLGGTHLPGVGALLDDRLVRDGDPGDCRLLLGNNCPGRVANQEDVGAGPGGANRKLLRSYERVAVQIERNEPRFLGCDAAQPFHAKPEAQTLASSRV